MLVDWQIRKALQDGYLGITPFDESRLGAVTYDLTAGEYFRAPRREHPMFATDWTAAIDSRQDLLPGQAKPEFTDLSVLSERNSYRLAPGCFVLVSVWESLVLSREIVARVEPKSTLERLGVHTAGGIVSPGFKGHLTVALSNTGPWPVLLHRDMPLVQLTFEQVERVRHAYPENGHYQGQTGATESRYRFLR